MHVFFFEVPRIEELQDPSSSPRREEVGRRTLREYGGFLPSFFYRARFRESTSTTRKRQARNIYPNKTPSTSGVEESNSPGRVLREPLMVPEYLGGHLGGDILEGTGGMGMHHSPQRQPLESVFPPQ